MLIVIRQLHRTIRRVHGCYDSVTIASNVITLTHYGAIIMHRIITVKSNASHSYAIRMLTSGCNCVVWRWRRAVCPALAHGSTARIDLDTVRSHCRVPIATSMQRTNDDARSEHATSLTRLTRFMRAPNCCAMLSYRTSKNSLQRILCC